VRGDTIDFPVYEELAVRIEMLGDEVERLMTLHPLTGEVVTEDKSLYVSAMPSPRTLTAGRLLPRVLGT
jgi:excinuclease UvrABC helicase subunit UvrB